MPQFARPQFLVNASLDREAEEFHSRELYRLDPLRRLVRTGVSDPVVTFLAL